MDEETRERLSRLPKWAQREFEDLILERDLWRSQVTDAGVDRARLWQELYDAGCEFATLEANDGIDIRDVAGVDLVVSVERSGGGSCYRFKWQGSVLTHDDHGRSRWVAEASPREFEHEEEMLVSMLQGLRYRIQEMREWRARDRTAI